MNKKFQKRFELYMKNPKIIVQNFQVQKVEINIEERMKKQGRKTYSWLEILNLKQSTFKRIKR